MVRALIATYILSGILLAILSFALFKFRLPENQVNLAVCAVYILSCFFGGMIAGKTMRTRRFFWGLVLGTLYFLFLYLMSLAQKDGVTEDTKRLLSVLAMCTLSGMAGRDGELTVSHLREEINNERQDPHHNEDSKHSLPHDP